MGLTSYTPDQLRRIGAAVRTVERDAASPADAGAARRPPDPVQLVNVTGPPDDGYPGEYPARLAYFDAAAGAFAYSAPVRFRPAGGAAPATDGSAYLLARYSGPAAAPGLGLYVGADAAAVRYARATPKLDDALQPIPDTYDLVEVESYPYGDGSYVLWRDKAGGVTGVGHRSPSRDAAGVPPITTGQTVIFTPSPLVAGEFDITPWGSHHRYTKKELVSVAQRVMVTDAGATVIANIRFYRNRREGARERCDSVAPVGETETPLG